MKHITTLSITAILMLLSINICFADIGIIVAFNSSLEQLKNSLKVKKITIKAGREFFSGNMGSLDIVLVRSPMGKVNNAITTQVLLSSYPITSVVSIAPAGAVQKTINIGDGVVASEVFQHDFGTIKPYGFIWNGVPDGAGWDEDGYGLTDESLRNLAVGCFVKKEGSFNQIITGCIVSGDQFISSTPKKQWLEKKFLAAAVDMSAAAIAQVCYANHKTPVCILRIITDRADLKARTDFARANPSFQTDIDIVDFVKDLLARMAKR